MKLCRSLYARPAIVRGQQCAEAPLGPGGATKQLHGSARAISRWKVASPPSLHGLRGTAGAVHRNMVWASQRAVARRGGPGGPAAGRAFVTLSVSSASVRRPVSGASDQCPRVPVQATGVQCPVRASERPGVRCPVSGVRCPCVPASAVSGRSEVMQRGGGAGRRTAGMAGVGVVARCVHDRLVVCPSRSLALEAGAGCAGPAEVSVWTWPSSWEVVGQWPRRSRGRQYTPAREDRSSVRSRVRSEVRLLRQAARHVTPAPLLRARPGSCTYPRRRTRHRIRHKAQRERNDVLAQIGGGDYAAWSSCEA